MYKQRGRRPADFGRPRRGKAMERWIASHNIENYEKALTTETDPVMRELIQQLLKDERRKYRASLLANEPKDTSGPQLAISASE